MGEQPRDWLACAVYDLVRSVKLPPPPPLAFQVQ